MGGSRGKSDVVRLTAGFLLITLPFVCSLDNSAKAASSNSEVTGSPSEDEDIDSNLIPLEPALTPTPLDLPSLYEKAAQVRDMTGSSPEPDLLEASEDSVGLSEEDTGSEGTAYNIPVVIDPTVEKHINFFNTSIRSRFEQWLVRFSRYRPLVENIFSEFDLPSDLVHLSLVESGFNPYAYSRARATGPWQFMKGTGKLYGLRIDHYVDERRDPIKSTVAAARYLRDLYDLFGTWPLAMAAYNAGEGKVMRALRQAKGDTFSDISKTKWIRRETKQYVPRIMAATVIAKNPDQYGFTQDPLPEHRFEEVTVTRPLHFRAIANATGIPYEELRLLNPELRRNVTPPNTPGYHLKVPAGTAEKVARSLEKVPTHKFSSRWAKTKRVKGVSGQWYRVRVGDTLEKLAKRFRVPVRTLKARNNLSSSLIKAGEFLLISR